MQSPTKEAERMTSWFRFKKLSVEPAVSLSTLVVEASMLDPGVTWRTVGEVSFFFSVAGLVVEISLYVDPFVVVSCESLPVVVDDVVEGVISIPLDDVDFAELIVTGDDVVDDVVGDVSVSVVVCCVEVVAVNEMAPVVPLSEAGCDCVVDITIVTSAVVGGNVVGDVIFSVVEDNADDVDDFLEDSVDDEVWGAIDDTVDDVRVDIVGDVVDDAVDDVVDDVVVDAVDDVVDGGADDVLVSVAGLFSSPIVHLSRVLKSKSRTLLRFP